MPCCVVLVCRCIDPYMPEHNASLLQYAAAMSGEFGEAEALAHRQAQYPELFGPTNMADGEDRPSREICDWQAGWE